MRRFLVSLALFTLASLGPLASRPASWAGATRAERSVAPFVRTCRTSVYGKLPNGWRAASFRVGRVWFVNFAGSDPRGWTDLGNGFATTKAIAVVRRGPAVTVSASPTESLALLYDPATYGTANTVTQGDTSVTFKPCRPGQSPYPQAKGRPTQFNGGLIAVDSPFCGTLSATPDGGAAVSKTLGMMGGSCP